MHSGPAGNSLQLAGDLGAPSNERISLLPRGKLAAGHSDPNLRAATTGYIVVRYIQQVGQLWRSVRGKNDR